MDNETINSSQTAIQCDSCGSENRGTAKFCSECGTKLQRRCPKCTQTVLHGARFCDNCGTPLITADDQTHSTGQSNPESPDHAATGPGTKDTHSQNRMVFSNPAERRQLTVMFCDMVNSSGLSEQLDPEDLRNVFAAYRSRCQVVVKRLGGHIARYVGDGLLVYFGYPVSYEDSAYRAIRAALGIVESVEMLDKEFSDLGIKLAVRVGINTGMVVVGDIGTGKERESMGVVGEVPNVAARLQASAYPGDIVIGDNTRRLIEGMFELEDLGEQAYKGISTPVHTWRIRKELNQPERFEVTSQTMLDKIIGRDAEIALVCERWKQVTEGGGQVMLLSGEAGIGKSRIIKQFRQHVKDQRHWCFLYYCSTHHQSSAFYPIIAQIEHNLGFDTSDTNETKLQKLKNQLESLKIPSDDNLPLYAFLLGIKINGKLPEGNPQELKQKTIQALINFYCILAKRAPTVMILEDIHWLDPSTFELLDLWIEQLQYERCYLILTFRPEFIPPWRHHSYFTSLALNRLSRRESEAIIREITGGKELPAQVLDDIIAKTDGVPLFLEELTKTIVKSNLLQKVDGEYMLHHSIHRLTIPESLQDSLMARLDQLEGAKELAQLAATVGRRFSHKLLLAASGLPETQFQSHIAKLLDAELIYKRGAPPDCIYEFKHALVQDIAYQTLLKSTRLFYHQRIAQLMEKQFSEQVEKNPELLAHHYTEAQLADKAVTLWHQAGQKAVSRSENMEAIDHLQRGLHMLGQLPESKECAKRELELQITLAVPLTSVKGYASPEVRKTYTRARELCIQIGDTPQQFPALYGMWRYYFMRAEYTTAEELSKQLVEIANQSENLAFSAAAPRSMAASCFYQGRQEESRKYLERVISLQKSDEYRSKALLFDVVDVEVVSHGYYAWTLWLQGFPDQARKHSEISVDLALKLGHQFSIALAYCFAAWTYQFCDDRDRTRELSELALKLSQKYSFQFWVGWAKLLQAWSNPQNDTGISRYDAMESGLQEWYDTGSELGQTYFITLLSQALSATGKYNESLGVLDKARSFAEESGETFWQAEIHRTRGEILIDSPEADVNQAESCFKLAMDVARKQRCKSLELRAAMSLAELSLKHDDAKKIKETHARLGRIYKFFSEGFDTSDLQKARTLLDNCSH